MSGQEYLTSNEEIAYPFAMDAAGVAEELLPKDFFIDAVITVPCERRGTVYLSVIEKVDSTTYKLHIRNYQNITLVTITIRQAELSASRALFRGTDGRTSVTLYVGPGFRTYLLSMSTTQEFGVKFPFEAATTEYVVPRVTTLQASTYNAGTVYLTGDVALREGYNTTLVTTENNSVQVNVVPGSGAGKYAQCDETPTDLGYIGSINGVTADADGNFRIVTGNCSRTYGTSTLTLANDCEPRCKTEDYAYVYAAMRKLYKDRLEKLKSDIYLMRDEYNALVTTYNSELLPEKRSVAVSIVGHSGIIAAANRYLNFTVEVYNHSCFDLSVIATISQTTGDATIPVREIMVLEDPVTGKSVQTSIIVMRKHTLEIKRGSKVVFQATRAFKNKPYTSGPVTIQVQYTWVDQYLEETITKTVSQILTSGGGKVLIK